MPLADVQLRRKPSHAQRGISSQILGGTAHDWVRLARVQVAKQKTLDAREPRGAVSGARRSACSSSCASTRVPVPVYRQPVSPFVEGELLEVIIEPSQFLRVRADLGKVL